MGIHIAHAHNNVPKYNAAMYFKEGVQSFQSGKSANKHLPHLIDPINYLVQTFDGQMARVIYLHL